MRRRGFFASLLGLGASSILVSEAKAGSEQTTVKLLGHDSTGAIFNKSIVPNGSIVLEVNGKKVLVPYYDL